MIPVGDPLENEQWALLQAHPGFRAALTALREDLEAAYGETLREQLIDDLAAEPLSAPYPLQAASQEWGLAPFILLGLALDSSDEWMEYFRDRANGILIRETPGEFTVRIPRPLTPAKREALQAWLKDAPREGLFERAYNSAGRRRQDRSPGLLEALPWFQRWNSGEAPAAIWREVSRKDRRLTFPQFHAQLVRIWQRLRAISPQGIRPDRPSRKAA